MMCDLLVLIWYFTFKKLLSYIVFTDHSIIEFNLLIMKVSLNMKLRLNINYKENSCSFWYILVCYIFKFGK